MPIDRGTIDAQLREIGEGERWWEQREFRDLPYVLHPEERMLGLVNGKLLGRRRPRVGPAGTWLIVATSHRILCLRQERFARKQVDITAGQITRVHQSNGLRACEITIVTSQRRYRLRISKADAFRFAGALAPLIPREAVQPLHPVLEQWAWVPGMTTFAALPGVSGLLTKAALLPAPDYATRAEVERLEGTVEQLRSDLERLQQQVAFLEDLLQKQADETFLARSPVDS